VAAAGSKDDSCITPKALWPSPTRQQGSNRPGPGSNPRVGQGQIATASDSLEGGSNLAPGVTAVSRRPAAAAGAAAAHESPSCQATGRAATAAAIGQLVHTAAGGVRQQRQQQSPESVEQQQQQQQHRRAQIHTGPVAGSPVAPARLAGQQQQQQQESPSWTGLRRVQHQQEQQRQQQQQQQQKGVVGMAFNSLGPRGRVGTIAGGAPVACAAARGSLSPQKLGSANK
jgi:hypothetical protein